MEYVAISKSERISPRKVGLVANVIRNQSNARHSVSVELALSKLSFVKKRGAYPLIKILKSAIANAVNKGAKKDALIISKVEITPAPSLKRYRPSTRGRTHPYKKRSSHIRVVLTDDKFQISNGKSQIRKKGDQK